MKKLLTLVLVVGILSLIGLGCSGSNSSSGTKTGSTGVQTTGGGTQTTSVTK